jgi:O-acetyl-ADP-ribose deacetylase (regulator of RNase III)
MLKHTQGNLIDLAEGGYFDVIVQGCNCFNTMGGGIAREIRGRYPSAAAVDADTQRGDIMKLGNWTEVTIDAPTEGHQFIIVNAYTQFKMSTGEDVFEYDAFGCVIRKLIRSFPARRIGLPYIGMGLAGGDPDIIMAYIENFAEEHAKSGGTVTLVEFK